MRPGDAEGGGRGDCVGVGLLHVWKRGQRVRILACQHKQRLLREAWGCISSLSAICVPLSHHWQMARLPRDCGNGVARNRTGFPTLYQIAQECQCSMLHTGTGLAEACVWHRVSGWLRQASCRDALCMGAGWEAALGSCRRRGVFGATVR